MWADAVMYTARAAVRAETAAFGEIVSKLLDIVKREHALREEDRREVEELLQTMERGK